MKKTLGTICNIIMLLVYIPVSFLAFVYGLFFFSLMDWSVLSLERMVWLFSCILLMLTPALSILSIVLSAIKRENGRYAVSFWIQFLPFGTIGLALIVMIFQWLFSY